MIASHVQVKLYFQNLQINLYSTKSLILNSFI